MAPSGKDNKPLPGLADPPPPIVGPFNMYLFKFFNSVYTWNALYPYL